MGHGKPGKSWNFRISFSRPGKSWKLSVCHGKSWKLETEVHCTKKKLVYTSRFFRERNVSTKRRLVGHEMSLVHIFWKQKTQFRSWKILEP